MKKKAFLVCSTAVCLVCILAVVLMTGSGTDRIRTERSADKAEILTGRNTPSETEEVSYPIDINSADAEILKSLPGIGEVLAAEIVAYRKEHGNFKSIEDIMSVSGIGQGRFDNIKDLITVGR